MLHDRSKRFKPLPKFNQQEWTKNGARRSVTVKFNNEKCGPTVKKKSDFVPLDWFNLFFPDKLWQIISNSTNSHVTQLLANNVMNDQLVDWIAIDVKTLKAFIGMAIIMGGIKFPRVSMYWQQSRKYASLGYFPYVLSMRRFSAILNSLEFDPQQHCATSDDLLSKVRTLLEEVIPCFQRHYIPAQELQISQATIPYAGNHVLDAQRRDGRCNSLNVRIICEIATGYISNLSIDRASSSNSISDAHNRIHHHQMKQLTQGLQYKNYKLYIDHQVMTADMADNLLNVGFYVCGLAKSDCSDIPQALKRVRPINNSCNIVQWRMRQQILACAIDQANTTNRLYFFSSMHSPPKREDTINGSVLRRQQLEEYQLFYDYQRWEKAKSKTILQAIQYFYNGGRYCKKWHRRVFFYLIECCLVNAFIVFKKSEQNYTSTNSYNQCKELDATDFLDFRLDIAEALIEEFLGNKSQYVVSKASNLQVQKEAEMLHRQYTESDYIHL